MSINDDMFVAVIGHRLGIRVPTDTRSVRRRSCHGLQDGCKKGPHVLCTPWLKPRAWLPRLPLFSHRSSPGAVPSQGGGGGVVP